MADQNKRLKQEDNPTRFLYLKPTYSKRPWFFGGKVEFSRDGETIYFSHQGGVGVIRNDKILKVLAAGDDIVSFALAVSSYEQTNFCRNSYLPIHELDWSGNFGYLFSTRINKNL